MITTDVKRSISHAAYVDNLKEYIKKRHDWKQHKTD